MRRIENECVSCGLPCLGDICPNRRVERLYCDKCENESELYEYGNKELCIDCLAQEVLDRVEGRK